MGLHAVLQTSDGRFRRFAGQPDIPDAKLVRMTRRRVPGTERIPSPPEESPKSRLVASLGIFGKEVLKSALGPLGGAAIEAAVALLPNSTQTSILPWLRRLAQATNHMRRSKIDVDQLRDHPEFADLVLAATNIAFQTADEQKQDRLRNVLLSSTSINVPGNAARARTFLRLIDELDEHHIQLLKFFEAPHRFMQEIGQPVTIEGRGYRYHEAWGVFLNRAFESFKDPELIDLAVDTLTRLKLVKFSPSVECDPRDNGLTNLGKDFAQFIRDPEGFSDQA